MERNEDLERRVAALEQQVGALAVSHRHRTVRRRASWGIGELPFYDIALGPDPERGETRGHARGIIAIGDVATGVIALGGLARGLVAVGGLALGLVSFGGLSIGVLGAVGGLAIGGIAIGGGAAGGVAVGGGAVGYYALGGGAAGQYVVTERRRDPEAVELFRQFGLEPPRQRR